MYKPTIWQDHVEGVQEGTDVNAKNLNNIEVGVMEAAALAALNSENSRYAVDTAKDATTLMMFQLMLTKKARAKEVILPEKAIKKGPVAFIPVLVAPPIADDGESLGTAGDIFLYTNNENTKFTVEYTGTAAFADIIVYVIFGGVEIG